MEYQLMEKEEQGLCADLAARAFADYEYFTVYFPGEKRRLLFLRSMIESEFRANEGRETFLTAKEDGRIAAAAILCGPDYRKPSDREYLRAGFLKSMAYGGFKRVGAWNEMEYEAIAPCKALKDAWYLNMLIVDPERKGQGIGTRMLREGIIPYVRQQGGKELCLFTNSEANRRFYRKNGFTEFDEKHFTHQGKTFGSWSFRMDLA